MFANAISETYADVERDVQKLTWAFVRQFKADYDETLSDCQYAFVLAYRGFDAGKATFLTHCHSKIQYTLLERKRQFGKAKRRNETPVAEPAELETPKELPAPIMERVAELSPDAQEIVKLVLQPPPDIKLNARLLSARGTKNNRAMRDALVEFLKDCGWCGKRILNSWSEVQEIL